MRNKIIRIALGLCLAVSMALPAFADINSSSLLGSGEDVTKIVKEKDSISVKNGETINILDYITVLVSNSQLANHDTLIFDIEDNADLSFIQDGSEYTAVEGKGTATAVIKSENEKVVQKIKLTATKGVVTYATGYKFENTTNNIAVNGGASNPEGTIKIVPTPTGAVFTQAHIDALKTSALAAVNGVTPTGDGTKITEGLASGEYKDFVIKFAADDLKSASTADVSNLKIDTAAFPMGNGSATNKRSATTKITFVQYSLKNQIASKGTITLMVGKTVDLMNNIKQGPSSASTADDVSFSIDYYNEASDNLDYATIEGTEITGVHTGKVKVIATLAGGAATSFVVNVVDFAATPNTDNTVTGNPALAFSVAKTAVGGTFKLSVKNVAADTKINYSSLDEKVASVDANGLVKGVAEGKTKVLADVNGTKLYCEVTVVKGAVDNSSKVPATGVLELPSLF